MTAKAIVVYGDFNCPWSYLASRRAELLAADGVQVDWRAVEHEPWCPGRHTDSSVRFQCVRREMETVLGVLLPEEGMPYSLAGFLPYTRAAVSAYAEGYAAGVAGRVRHLLFKAFWLHGVDLGDARLVRTLLVDAIRSGSSPSELLHDWGYPIDVTGGPVTSTAWRLVGQWAEEWHATGKETVPVLVPDGGEPMFGQATLDWLGAELASRRIDVSSLPIPVEARPPPAGEPASLS